MFKKAMLPLKVFHFRTFLRFRRLVVSNPEKAAFIFLINSIQQSIKCNSDNTYNSSNDNDDNNNNNNNKKNKNKKKRQQ